MFFNVAGILSRFHFRTNIQIAPPPSISLKLSSSESLGKEALLLGAWAATGGMSLFDEKKWTDHPNLLNKVQIE